MNHMFGLTVLIMISAFLLTLSGHVSMAAMIMITAMTASLTTVAYVQASRRRSTVSDRNI